MTLKQQALIEAGLSPTEAQEVLTFFEALNGKLNAYESQPTEATWDAVTEAIDDLLRMPTSLTVH